jgi:hypothetical protein
MADLLHPAATHHLPSFVTSPGGTDVLMIVTAIFLLAAVVGFGVLFLRLHALPEHIAHGTHKVQMELVSVLCLIALFTHMHIFWIAGLILAFIEIPNFGHPLRRIAGSVEKMAGIGPGAGAAAGAPEDDAEDAHSQGTHLDDARPHDGADAPAQRPATTSGRPAAAAADKELSHA